MFNSTNNKKTSLVYNTTTITIGNTNGKRRKQKTNCCYQLGANIPARLVLYFLSWSGFLVSFMMRNDINFALVAMTEKKTYFSSGDHFNNITNSSTVQSNYEEIMQADEVYGKNDSIPVSSTLSSVTILPDSYDWSTTVKSIVISSFYWCYVLSQVVGGIATQYYGTKHVFGWSQLVTAICSLLIPWGADIHYSVIILLRSIQGFASGLTWPAMYALVGYWIPLSERSRFMSSFQGFSIGIGLTYPLCGFIIEQFGWRYVFYTTGSLGIAWCIVWYLYAFNTPALHPRIHLDELNYIERNVNAEMDTINSEDQVAVPWAAIFCSKAAWAIAITTFGRIWIHYIFIVCGPSFMQNMLKFNYQTNGFLSGLPFICSYVSSVIFCYAADWFVASKRLSLTQVRKLCTALSQIVPGLLLLWIGYIDHDIKLLLCLWFISVIFITASYAGAMANIVDIAPNFAAPVLAFCQTIHMSASFLSPLVAGLIVVDESSIQQWQAVFGVSTIISLSTYFMFQLWGTAEIQSWNHVQKPATLPLVERQINNVTTNTVRNVEYIEKEEEREPLQKNSHKI